MGLTAKIKDALTNKSEFGVIAAIFNFFQGRSTFFAIVFLIVGLILSATAVWGIVHGKDVTALAGIFASLAAYMGGLQGLLFAHSCKEDWVALQHRKLDIQEQQLNVTINSAPPAPPAQSA